MKHGVRFESPIAICGPGDVSFPRRLAVELRMRSVAEFEPTIAALEIVCRASVQTGNPVVWT